MKRRNRDARTRQLVTGLALIVLGGTFIFHHFGLIRIDASWAHLWRYWPLLLVALGVAHIFDRGTSTFQTTSEILQGFLFLAITFNWRGLNWTHFAPLFLMTLGVAWIVDALLRKTPEADDSLEGDFS